MNVWGFRRTGRMLWLHFGLLTVDTDRIVSIELTKTELSYYLAGVEFCLNFIFSDVILLSPLMSNVTFV